MISPCCHVPVYRLPFSRQKGLPGMHDLRQGSLSFSSKVPTFYKLYLQKIICVSKIWLLKNLERTALY